MWCKLFILFMFVYDKNKDTFLHRVCRRLYICLIFLFSVYFPPFLISLFFLFLNLLRHIYSLDLWTAFLFCIFFLPSFLPSLPSIRPSFFSFLLTFLQAQSIMENTRVVPKHAGYHNCARQKSSKLCRRREVVYLPSQFWFWQINTGTFTRTWISQAFDLFRNNFVELWGQFWFP